MTRGAAALGAPPLVTYLRLCEVEGCNQLATVVVVGPNGDEDKEFCSDCASQSGWKIVARI